MVKAEKWAKKIKWGRCQLAIALLLCVASLVFLTFSVLEVVYHEHAFVFSSAFHLCRSLKNISLVGRILGK